MNRYYLCQDGSHFYDMQNHNIVSINIQSALYFNFIDAQIGYYGIDIREYVGITDEEFEILREVL